MSGYAELHCLSNFSFQRGASSALELFERAQRLGYQALAITDECSLAGIVRAWQAARTTGVPLIVGSEVRIEAGPKLVLLASNLTGYQQLCHLITQARRRAEKGRYRLRPDDLQGPLDGLLLQRFPRVAVRALAHPACLHRAARFTHENVPCFGHVVPSRLSGTRPRGGARPLTPRSSLPAPARSTPSPAAHPPSR